MRVTESLIYARMSNINSGAKNRLDKATIPLMTGLKHTKPSEDPMHAQRVEQARRGAREAERVQDSISQVNGYYEMLDTTLTNMTDTVNELSTLAIQMANGSVNAEERALAATHVEQLMDYLKTMANSRHDGRYLFAGRLEDTRPYADDFSYQGDDVPREIPIGAAASIPLDVLGPSVFGDEGAGELSVFAAAETLRQALLDNDDDAISAALEGLDTVHGRVVAARSSVGMVMNDLNHFGSYYDDQAFAYRTAEAELSSADIAKAASDLSFAEQVYQASLASTQRMNSVLQRELEI